MAPHVRYNSFGTFIGRPLQNNNVKWPHLRRLENVGDEPPVLLIQFRDNFDSEKQLNDFRVSRDS